MSKKPLFLLQKSGPRGQYGRTSPDKRFNELNNSPARAFWVIVFVCITTPWIDQILRSLRNVKDKGKLFVFLLALNVFFHDILPKLVPKPFLPQATTIFGCCFKNHGTMKMLCRHHSGLFRVFCSLEQNAWNTFNVFRNWNSVSIERLFGLIPFSYSGIGSIERTLCWNTRINLRVVKGQLSFWGSRPEYHASCLRDFSLAMVTQVPRKTGSSQNSVIT